MKEYNWSGNIREFKNVVERDYYLSEDEIMNINCLNYDNVVDNIDSEELFEEEIKIVLLDYLEKNVIKDVIKKCNGNF